MATRQGECALVTWRVKRERERENVSMATRQGECALVTWSLTSRPSAAGLPFRVKCLLCQHGPIICPKNSCNLSDSAITL
ncbi:hypothetical protein CesoFtcFv8_019872 [Champsocephalus esox]|uniref:Uncharacterized protein n=1 Tax=Champsocephalus esox TaxID=159716 RepID=A0AAN8BEN4_9TELE|nr:hypothetical protein CesoFtcFv8_019872 [Champsocephalus esox]